MAILSGDIKLVESQTMDDVPEGGGAPVAAVVTDGESNGIFNDISELDRAGGRVNLRKTFVSVQTLNVDGYFGANVIVADPPDDPNVSVTLFSTEDVFDQRAAAKSRIEAYLAPGPVYAGYLYGNHISGQGAITILQREEVALPVVGDTFMLRKFEGMGTQYEQYVRVNDVSSSVRTFSDGQGDFKRRQVVLSLSDVLRADFPGFDALRYDTSVSYANNTKTYSTIVADAARYYGVVPLTADAAIGDFTVQAEGIFTQIVPSTKIEVPIADARMNQQSAALVTTGSSLSQTLTLAFTTTQALYVGGGILPGSLSVVRSGITLTDAGGVLTNAGTQVGTVDYLNGILTLSANVFGTGSGAHTVSYTPAAAPTMVSQTIGIPVTQQGQRLTWVLTLDPAPAKRSLQVSYRTLGNWYVLTDDGSGALRGADSAFGAGSLNYTTGTVSLTLGALPDVGSQLILAWAPAVTSRPLPLVPSVGPTVTQGFGKQVTIGQAIKPGTVVLTWNDGTARTATDSGGVLTGDATGAVYYGEGRIDFRPNLLPAKNTAIGLTITEATRQVGTVSAFVDGGANWTFALSAPVKTHSVELSVIGQYPMRQYPGTDATLTQCVRVFDDGSGNLQIANGTSNLTVGTINYSTGACTLNKTAALVSDQPTFATTAVWGGSSGGSASYQTTQSGYQARSVPLSFLNGPPVGIEATRSAWAWWSGAQGVAAQTRYAGSDGSSAQSYPFVLDELFMRAAYAYSSSTTYAPSISSFTLGGQVHVQQLLSATWVYVKGVSPTTGVGTQVGEAVSVLGLAGVRLTAWTAGISPIPTSVNGASAPAVSGVDTQLLVGAATFRTAVAPLFNGGFTVAGNWKDGTGFTATADNAGVIATGSAPPNSSTYGSLGVFGKVDYESGVVTLRFGRRAPAELVAETGVIDISDLGLTGVVYLKSDGAQSDTLRYSAVAYKYLPLDADLLGLDPVRLPSNGKVPIFRPGSFAVLGNTGTVGPVTVSNAQVINCARVRLSRVRVIGANGGVINTGYTANLEAGTVTFTDVTGYSQPVSVEHRVEDMMLVSDVQINGQMSFTRPVTHNYSTAGSYVSSALVAGDMRARVSTLFDQVSWTNAWSDSVIGSIATATFNSAASPIVVNNKGALTERWAIQFTNTTSFQVIGEHVGIIATGNTGTDCAPVNPATGQPYFTIPAAGWGLGWSTGNVLRFNTVGAFYPVWVIRTIQQGPETVDNDAFTLLVRGDIDNP